MFTATSSAVSRILDDDLPDNEYYFDRLHDILTGPPFIGVPPEPTAFVDLVYVGTIAQSENLELLKRLKFTHVLNCAGRWTSADQNILCCLEKAIMLTQLYIPAW